MADRLKSKGNQSRFKKVSADVSRDAVPGSANGSPEDEKSFVLRYTARHHDFLERCSKERGLDRTKLATRIIERVMEMEEVDPRDLDDFLKGLGPVHKASEIVERLQWAAHAFEMKQFWWAAEEYLRLADGAPSTDGVFRLAQYRLGYCWVLIARELRRSSLESIDLGPTASSGPWERGYDAADWALCASIYYNTRYSVKKKHEKPQIGAAPDHAVVLYNLACAWALRAQYATERMLSPAERHELRESIMPSIGHHSSSAPKLPQRASPSQKNIQQYRASALAHLKSAAEKTFEEPPTDSSFLLRRACFDEDLQFLRESDSSVIVEMQKAEANSPLVGAFQRLQSVTPKYQRIAIGELHETVREG